MTNIKKRPVALIFTVCAVLAAVCAFCAVVGALKQAIEGSGENAMQAARQITQTELNLTVGDIEVLNISDVQDGLLDSWTSSNESVATVDSGGRVDAVGEGSAVITAQFSNGMSTDFTVDVQTAETDETSEDSSERSTCITANLDRVEENKKNTGVNLYYIAVNRKANCVTVYTYDDDGNYTVPVRAMVCSTGSDNSTITGTFEIGIKSEWLSLVGDVYGRYISGISGDYLFHSVPYYTTENSELETEEFNKLGEQASQGCVRLAVADAKWIYDNCPEGTEVYIYDSADLGPLGKPDTIKITDESIGWDPTDSDESSPYANLSASISGAKDLTLSQNEEFDVLDGITATDSCGSDAASDIEVKGNVVTSRKGTYKVTYSITDALKGHDEVTITVTVV